MSTLDAPVGTATPATFSLGEYEHMVAVGAFTSADRRLELLWGEIVTMSPIGPQHSDDVDFLMSWSIEAVKELGLRVRVQQPIRLPGSDSELEPDISWVVEQSYRERHPNPDEVLLVIEVAETSAAIDRGPKLAAYAAAGVPEYWIVDLPAGLVEVCRQPEGQTYANRSTAKPGETITPQAAPPRDARSREAIRLRALFLKRLVPVTPALAALSRSCFFDTRCV